MKRAAGPAEFAKPVLHLCPPMVAFATGQTFILDGGQTAH